MYGKGSAIVFIHGFGTDSYTWRNNIPALSRYFRLYVPDLIGFGNSDKPETNYCRPFFTEQIHQFLRSLKIAKPTLIGASWGGGMRSPLLWSFQRELINSLSLIP